MEIISTSDILVLKTLATGLFIYSGLGLFSSLQKKPAIEPLIPPKKEKQSKLRETQSLLPTRSIRKQLEHTGRQCVVFYGTQTGTASQLAFTFARDALATYGLQCLVADVEDYDFDDLAALGSQQTAVFFLATFGEGEPTDNAVALSQFLAEMKDAQTLQNTQFAAFGLGSSSYEFYNEMIKRLDKAFLACGAKRLGSLGLGDSGKGTMEEDFSEWEAVTLPLIAAAHGLEKKERSLDPAFSLNELLQHDQHMIFRGEPNKAQLIGRVKGPFTPKNPYPATVTCSRPLFSPQASRQCLHIEFDTSGSTLSYETGDHLAIWPVTSDVEVERFLTLFGLTGCRDTSVQLSSNDPTVQVPIPTRITYDAAARHYLDLCGPVSRKALSVFAQYANNDQVKAATLELANSSSAFTQRVKDRQLTLSQCLQTISPTAWSSVPFVVLVEMLGALKPRFYSISSSSKVSRHKMSITAVIEQRKEASWDFSFEGVSTSYLAALSSEGVPTHRVSRVEGSPSLPRVYIHVRASKFRLPKQPSTPIVMVGPGTGVAPFRAFVQERALLAQKGVRVGRTLLFYGCRNEEDSIYSDEWKVSSLDICVVLRNAAN